MLHRHAAIVFGLVLGSSGLFGGTESPVITHLETRDHKITVMSSSEGTFYTVRGKAGAVLANEMSEGMLAKDQPDLYRLVKSAIAQAHSGLDASVQMRNGEKRR